MGLRVLAADLEALGGLPRPLGLAEHGARVRDAPRRIGVADHEEIGERRFAGWAMGLIDLSRLNPALLLKYSEAAVLDPYALSGRVSMALFDELIATASVSCSP